jgi:hypothetical protein
MGKTCWPSTVLKLPCARSASWLACSLAGAQAVQHFHHEEGLTAMAPACCSC